MLDLSWTHHAFVVPPMANHRVLVLVDHATAHPRLLGQLAPTTAIPPGRVLLLWVVTPSSVVSWGALLAEPNDRTHMMLSAVSERMEEARRRLLPLQRACSASSIPCQVHIVHGSVAESVVRLARDEQVDQVLLPVAEGAIYGQSPQEFATLLSRRLTIAVGMIAFDSSQAPNVA